MRSLVSDLSSHNATPAARALRWVLPWSRRDYPGFHRGVTQIIDHWVTYSAVQHWCTGRRRMQVADAIKLRNMIAARLADGQDVLAELDHYIATESNRPRRLAGFCAVDADGMDQRHRVGRSPLSD
jgi:hypothetical protein